MAYTYTTINGQRVETHVAAAFQRLRAAFKKRWDMDLLVSSGTRTRAEQQHLYNLYRAGKGNLAAAPGYSNHEESGPRGPRALDVRDSGSSAGVTVRGSARANWLKANAPSYGFDPAGYRFSQIEPWHIEYTGALTTPAGGGTLILFGNLPTEYIRALQSQLGVGVDGLVGAGTIAAIQKKVGAGVDGIWGPDTLKAIQKFIGTGVDGIWGTGTTNAFKFAIDAGRFGQPLHVLIGDAHTRKLQAQLKVGVDGNAGSGTISALQQKIGAGVDGIFGRGTMSKLQAFVGAGVDGIWGPDTTNKVRAAIDAGKFGTVVTTPTPDPEPEVPAEPEIPAEYAFGIDVAWPQTGVFDWAKVNNKQDFVIIKAAGAEGGDEGIYGPAELLDKHLAGARTTNMRVGFYFFNNNRHPVKAQADKFIEVLKTRIRPGDFVALDIEDVGAHKVAFNPEQALEFAEYIREALDIRTFMYLNRSHVNGADWSKVVEAGHPLWLATLDGLTNGLTYLLPNSVKWWGNASIVQFSSTTPIEGYPHGPVDQNIAIEEDIFFSEFVAFPTVEEPTDEDETPSWFRRFLEGLIQFFRTFLGSK